MSPSSDLPEAVDPRRLAEILQQIADAAIVQLVAEAQPSRPPRAVRMPLRGIAQNPILGRLCRGLP